MLRVHTVYSPEFRAEAVRLYRTSGRGPEEDLRGDRAKLKAEGYEHDVRFARLHEKRVEIIADLYAKLVEADIAFASWYHPLQVAGEPTAEEKGKRAAAAGDEFVKAFTRNRIWLDEDLVKSRSSHSCSTMC